jgi:hypothetical protein
MAWFSKLKSANICLRRLFSSSRCPEPGQLGHAGPGIFAFPSIKRRLAQAVLAHDLRDGLPAGLLLPNGHNLGFAESSFFHLAVVR